jgi:hypothetical protein
VTGKSNAGVGVYAESIPAGHLGQPSLADGIFGLGKNGVHGQSSSATDGGVWGENTGAGIGVKGTSKGGLGVYGQSDQQDGVNGLSSDAAHSGVMGRNESGYGVWGASVSNYGVYATSTNGIALWAESASKAAGHFEGDVEVNGNLTASGSGQVATLAVTGNGQVSGDLGVTGTVRAHDVSLTGGDCAEMFDVGAVGGDPGTVMVIGEQGRLRESVTAYDKCVAGVVSGAGTYSPGIVLDGGKSKVGRVTVALVGKVYCKVDARYAAIQPGDLLTTSPTPGHAMKANDATRALGSVIGKAMARLEDGKALIPILIALQ